MESSPRVVPVQDFDLDKISLENFENRMCEVHYEESEDFVIKTNQMKITKATQSFVDLLPVNTEDVSVFNLFDDRLISLLSEKSLDWFKNSLSIDDIDDMYVRSVRHKNGKNTLRVYIGENTDVYNQEKQIVGTEFLEEGKNIKCILKLSKAVFQTSRCNVNWDLFQCILMKEKPKKKLLIEDD